jgi:hypothetical protein
MKINQLAAKPQLIKIVLDDEDIVKEYGEPIEVWTWDRQPLETFMKLANSQGQDTGMIVDIVKNLVLDEEGRQVIQDGKMLPTKVLLPLIQKIVETLGK